MTLYQSRNFFTSLWSSSSNPEAVNAFEVSHLLIAILFSPHYDSFYLVPEKLPRKSSALCLISQFAEPTRTCINVRLFFFFLPIFSMLWCILTRGDLIARLFPRILVRVNRIWNNFSFVESDLCPLALIFYRKCIKLLFCDFRDHAHLVVNVWFDYIWISGFALSCVILFCWMWTCDRSRNKRWRSYLSEH